MRSFHLEVSIDFDAENLSDAVDKIKIHFEELSKELVGTEQQTSQLCGSWFIGDIDLYPTDVSIKWKE